MEITNYSISPKSTRQNSPLLPTTIRGLIVGKCNSGKTTLLLNLLLKPNWLDYNRLYVFGNSLQQLEYQTIKKGFESGLSKEQINNIFQNKEMYDISPLKIIEDYDGIKEGGIVANFYSDCSFLPDPSELDEKKHNLLILDDCHLGPQSKARSYFTRGRHNACDTIYISQSYFQLDRKSVRENSNIIMLFPQDNKNLNHIHSDHCTDLDISEFKHLCKTIWNEKHAFLTIDITSTIQNGKYRRNLDSFYIPDSYINSNKDQPLIEKDVIS